MKMKNRVLILIAYITCFTLSAAAQKPAEAKSPAVLKMDQLFLTMPEEITPLLTAVNRADMVDFKENNMKAEVTNALGGTSEMVTLSDSYIYLKTSKSSSLQIKLLPYFGTSIIAVVETVNGPAEDSHITFYNLDWKENKVASGLVPKLSFENFYYDNVKSATETQLAALKSLNLLLYSVQLAAENNDITIQLSTMKYLDKSVAEKVSLLLKPQLELVWTEKGYALR